MLNLREMLIFEYESEYDFKYDLSQKKLFSDPKIYTANGDLSKRWYVYFSYRNPKNGKLKRMPPIYGTVNAHKTKEARLTILTAYRKSLFKYLKQGFSPFEDNTDQFYKPKVEKDAPKMKSLSIEGVSKKEEPKMTIEKAFDFALKNKEKLIKEKTKVGYQNKVKNFLIWLKEHYPKLTGIDQLNKKIVLHFLNDVLARTSARNRNNFRTDLNSLLQVMEENEIITSNFVKSISVLKSIPKRHKTYTPQLEQEIFDYLKQKDPIMLLFIKFISYNFLRPIEVCRLKVGDVDIRNKEIRFLAKNSPSKIKIIPDILLEELPDLSKLKPHLDLFTKTKLGGEWDATSENKRGYFTARFKEVVKSHFKLGEEYGLYSFRHTFITKLYREIAKSTSPYNAKGKLMQITGHSSMTALEKYLRDIDAEMPMDYSDLLRTK